MPTSAHPDVFLVGRKTQDNENLGLGYLRAALEQAGLRSRVGYASSVGDVVAIARQILSSGAPVVGLSLSDGGSAFIPLSLGELLQRRGYRGHVTCGGQFATLARHWLLERYPWLDSVVRFAGERPLVDLVQRVQRCRSIEGIGGLTTREGDGAPAPVLDSLPMTLRPLHDKLPEILGHRAAHLAVSRGCKGRCGYCGPAALQRLERHEGLRLGIAAAELTDCGVGGVRRRALNDVCDEMAELWHREDVRYFYVVDEHFLPYSEADALDLLRRWRRGLVQRKVGRFGLGAMLRADRLTPTVADELARFGMVRAFVGLELAQGPEAHRFGRPPAGANELELLQRFARHGVVTVSNLMLLHPYSTPDSIAAGLALLSQIQSGLFEVSRMMVYHGTHLHECLAAEGRLTGNPLRYGYRIEDPIVARFEQVASRLRAEAFLDHSLAHRTHDTQLAVALARHLHPEVALAPLLGELEHLRAQVNALGVGAYRAGFEAAIAGSGFAEVGPLVTEVSDEAHTLTRRLLALEDRLEAVLQRPLHRFSPFRAAAASAISVYLAGGIAAACGGQTKTTSSGVHDDAGARDADGQGADGQDASDALVDAGVEADADLADDAGGCPEAELATQDARVARLLAEEAPCFSGTVRLPEGSVWLSAFEPGNYNGLNLCGVVAGNETDATIALTERAEQALVGQTFTCETSQWIETGVRQDILALDDQAQEQCDSVVPLGCVVRVDATGRVVDVAFNPAGPNGESVELAACIQDALLGLEFPCLANFEVCRENIIIE